MSESRLIVKALELTGIESGLSVSGLVHLIPFLIERRTSCRLVMGKYEAEYLAKELQSNQLVTILKPLKRTKKGDDWVDFSLGTTSSDYRLLVTSRDRFAAENLIDSELHGSAQVSGSLLGYPTCCVNAYDEICQSSRYWPNYYLKKSNNVSPWCNRLALLWGGCCPTGELFPCSLTCDRAIMNGKENIYCLKEAGLERLASLIWGQANEPISVDRHGKISKNGSTSKNGRLRPMIFQCA